MKISIVKLAALVIALLFCFTGNSQVTIINNSNFNGFNMGNVVGPLSRTNIPNGVRIESTFGPVSCTLDTMLNLTCYDSLLVTVTMNKGNTWGTCSLNAVSASVTPATYSYITSNTSNLSFTVDVTSSNFSFKQNLYVQALKIIGYPSTTTCSSAPSQPLVITGPTTVCANSTNVYITPPICGATSYNWSLPTGWTGSSTTNTISVMTTTTSGNISVTASNTCGISPIQSLNLSVNNFTPAVPGSISGLIQVCYGVSSVYSISPVSGATSYSWSFPSGWGSPPNTANTITVIPTSSGTLSIVASNSCNSSLAQTYSVNVYPQNNVSVTINPNPICVGQSATLTMSCSKMQSYYWNVPGGNPLVVTPTINTNYQATALDSNNCSTSLWSTVIVLTCTEINTHEITNDGIIIYPNPFNNKITLVSKSRKKSVQIYNTLGSIIYSAILEDEKSEIDLSNLSSGIYFIQTSDEKMISTKRIIKE